MAKGRLHGIAFLAVLRHNFLQILQRRIVQDDFSVRVSINFSRFFLATNTSKLGNHLAHGFKTSSALCQLFLLAQNGDV